MRLFTLCFAFLSLPQEIEDRDSINSYCVMCSLDLKSYFRGTSLVIQWLRLCASNAGAMGLIPGRGAKISHAVWPKNKQTKKSIKSVRSIIFPVWCVPSNRWKHRGLAKWHNGWAMTTTGIQTKVFVIKYFFHCISYCSEVLLSCEARSFLQALKNCAHVTGLHAAMHKGAGLIHPVQCLMHEEVKFKL